MNQYRRRLPHVHPEGRPLFLTWHLHGSLPNSLYPPPGKLNSGAAFAWIDRFLDAARSGPTHLGRTEVARLVVEAIQRGDKDLRHYELHAFAVMPNHVHLLATPRVAPSQFMRSLKGFTAREANKILKRTGEPFWQHESYDHWVRDGTEFAKIRSYIEQNPVKAGLVNRPQAFPWSSAALSSERGASS